MPSINSKEGQKFALKWPHLLLVVARRNSGKSHLLKFMLFNSARLHSFQSIFVISPTSFNGEWSDIVGKKNVSNVYCDEWLERLLTAQAKLVKKGKPNEMLLILDDCVGSAKFNDSVMTKIAIAGRHFKLSVWITAQAYTKIPPVIRTNADYMMILNKIPPNIIEFTLHEFPPDNSEISHWKTLSAYASLVTQNYGVLLIDNSGQGTKYMQIRVPAKLPSFKLA